MKLVFTVDSEGKGYVAALESANPGEGTAEHRKAAGVGKGQRIELDLPDLVSAGQIGFGSVTDSVTGVVVTPSDDEAKEAADTPGGGNEGSPQNVEPPAPESAPPTSAEGEGGGAPAEGGGTQSGEPPSTSAASEKPLYLVDGERVPDGFVLSGLMTLDERPLWHFSGDTAGQSATGNVDGVSVYADADDNEKPVQPATPAEGQEKASA